MDVQPVAAADVASALAELVVGRAEDGIVELAGPDVLHMDELGRKVLSAKGDPRRTVTDPEATYFGAHLEMGTLTPGSGARLGRRRLEEWLEEGRGDS